jgi:vancomycin permeability regulator SanA
VNGLGGLVRPRFSTLGEWVSLAGRGSVTAALAAGIGSALIWHGLGGSWGRLRRLVAGAFVAVALVAFRDAVGFYRLVARGAIETPAVLPGSLVVLGFFAALAFDVAHASPRTPWTRRRLLETALGVAAVLVALPVIRVLTFGPTRYERHADVAVVLGARAYADGKPSLALSDRVEESVRAYRNGLVSRLIMSGGVDRSSGVSEPQVMRAQAIAEGVPADAILLDEAGTNTAMTARNVSRLLRGGESVLLITHYFHLPRTTLLFHRAGIRTFTLPATMTRRLALEPWFVLREVPAFYVAWLTA